MGADARARPWAGPLSPSSERNAGIRASTSFAQRSGVNCVLNPRLAAPIARRSSSFEPLILANALARPTSLPGLTTAPL